MNISYACDDKYIEQTIVSMVSLFENNKSINDITIYFIDMGISNSSMHELVNIINLYNRQLIVIPFNQIAYDLKIDKTGRHIASVYAKLFFGRITDVDRILYLDSDTVIVDELYNFYNIELKDSYVAGVETIHDIRQNQEIGFNKDDRAINDGVVLMNLKLWREDNMLEKCLNFIKLNNGKPPVLSEGTLNAVCKNKILIVHPRYNLMTGIVDSKNDSIKKSTSREYYDQEIIEEAKENPCIVHFLAGFYNRPWNKDCTHPLKHFYTDYKKLTIWAEKPLDKKKLPLRYKLIGYIYHNVPIELFIKIRKLFK